MLPRNPLLLIIQQVLLYDIPRDFFSIESLGVQGIPKCGSCRCGSCPVGSKPYILKEERELNMISEGLSYDSTYWVAIYPWIKDPRLLPSFAF